jgi:hypothetical protein
VIRLGVVVDEDPGGRCSSPVGQLLALDDNATFVVGRGEACDLVVADRLVSRRHCGVSCRDGGWVVDDHGGPGGVWINGRRIARRHRLGDGDVLNCPSGVVIRFVVVDPLSSLSRRGRWLRLAFAPRAPAPAFCVDGGLRRGWLVTSRGGDDDGVEAFARAAATRPGLPRLIDAFSDDDGVHRVFEVGDHVTVERFAARATPTPLPVVLRIATDLTQAWAALFDASQRQPRDVRCAVTFDGAVVVVPGARPLVAAAGAGANVSELVSLLRLLQPAPPGLTTLLATRWPDPLAPFDEGFRRLARQHGAAGDDELGAVVRGLFPDEHRAAGELQEQLETLDDDGVARLLKASAGR